MASPGLGPGGVNVTQETSDAIEEYNEELEDDVDKWINRARYIPKDGRYDYRPLCRALIENHRGAKGIFSDPPTPAPEDITNSPKRSPGAKDVMKGIQPQDEPLGLAPDPGKGWTYVRYLPAWMDPEYTEDKLVTPAGNPRYNTVRDAIYNLRPALRLADQFRRPTDYALRFGIAADRLDGRSRMSPTWSVTRNPFDSDLWRQIEQLSEENRQLALQMSLERWKKLGRAPEPGLEILPDVMEELLEKHGLVGNVGLATKIENEVRANSLDEMLYRLKSENSEVLKVHQGFLEMLKDDQDYQRVLMMGLTTDELVQHNIHTMSNDVVIDLDNPIHFLFDRDRWDDGWWRGQRESAPRNVYNINGKREEYNVATNDELWNALQPALRLVSMVIAKSHPCLEAIMNMNTRQPIPIGKGDEGRYPPTRTRYVLEEDIDMSKTYPALRQLNEVHNYDWKANVLRVLERAFVIDIEPCHILGASYKLEDSVVNDAHRDIAYATCGTYEKYGKVPGEVQPGEVMIKLKLGAEIIWPLLVPQYSESEKMASSFVIASTLLHEFAHAVNQAQELLTTREWQEPGQDPEIEWLLNSLDGVVWDVAFGAHGEPYYYDEGGEELGHSFEHALWGRVVTMTGEHETSRFHQSLMFALGEETHPIAAEIYREDVAQPMMRYMRPVPIDYMAKLFSRRFWNEEFEAYGPGALRMMPDNYLQKNLMQSHVVIPDVEIGKKLYGRDKAGFLNAVPTILLKSRHNVLGSYLNALRMEEVNWFQYKKWWAHEVYNWEDDLLHPLEGTIELLDIEFQNSRDLNLWHLGPAQDKVSYFGHYLNTIKPGDAGAVSYPEWQEDIAEQWKEMLRYGGWLMQRLLAVHNHMQNDIGNLQRMTSYFLAIKPPNAGISFNEGDEYTLPGVLYDRLDTFRSHAERITEMIHFYTNWPEVHDTKDKWEQWEARFKYNGQQYSELMQTLRQGAKVDSKPFDISWKPQFNRLPTGNWRQVSEVYKKMAHREYNMADPAIRKTIDDYVRELGGLNLVDHFGAKVTIRKIGRVLKSMKSVGKKITGTGEASIFDFVPPPASVPGSSPNPADPKPPQPPPAPNQPPPSTPPHNGHIFGVPGGRGIMQSSMMSPPRRVAKEKSNAQNSTAYQSYMTNLLTTPDPKTTWGVAADLFKSGLPQPIRDLLPSQNRSLGKSRGTPIEPFPNPYAGRNIMTSVEAAFQQQKELVDKSRQVQQRAGGVYAAPSLWREKAWGSGDDDDVEMS